MAQPPAKRARLLSDESASDHSDVDDAASTGEKSATLNINSDFAKRFEHNEQRAERQRLQEKYGKQSESGSASDSDSTSESEDDEGELVTEELDNEILNTLSAIRNKDPRVYDKQSQFYKMDPEASKGEPQKSAQRKDKPVHLHDYHRKNFLQDAGELPPDDSAPLYTYDEEQSALKRDLLDQMHKTAAEDQDSAESADDDDFLVRKPGQKSDAIKARPPPRQDLDIATADRDPDTYLSNFIASRAWVPSATSKYQPFESDDDEDDERADAFETAYNMRFEDPEHANEKLVSHSREAAAKYSVRREDAKGRKKAREEAKARRDAEKLQREEEKARLRRLKIDEAQEKWLRLKEAAGLKKQHLSDEKLLKFLEQGFDDENWDVEMAKLLGETYYAEKEDEDLQDDEDDGAESSKHAKKPKWDDDIDIGDIVPDFDEEEERQRANITLSDDDLAAAGADDDDDVDNGGVSIRSQADYSSKTRPDQSNRNASPKDAKRARQAAKRDARLARQKIETLVDAHLATTLDDPSLASASTSAAQGRRPPPAPAPFRYRATSPVTHGLTSRDILMASDSQLNQFAGLKKLATFRDDAKKARDRRHLGKKARLREWRRETFGDEAGGEGRSFEEFVNRGRMVGGGGSRAGAERAAGEEGEENVRGETGEKRRKKRKRSGKNKIGQADDVVGIEV